MSASASPSAGLGAWLVIAMALGREAGPAGCFWGDAESDQETSTTPMKLDSGRVIVTEPTVCRVKHEPCNDGGNLEKSEFLNPEYSADSQREEA